MNNELEDKTEVMDEEIIVNNATLTDREKNDFENNVATIKEAKTKIEPIKYIISGMLWIGFVVVVAIIIYIVINEPDFFSKVIDKIFK